VKSRTLEIDYQLDNPELGAKCLGIILLSTDLTLERDIHRIIQDNSITAYINRVTYDNPMTVENLAALEANLKQAAIDLLPGAKLDAIAFACTSGSIAIGPDRVLLRLEEGQPGVPSTTPINAALDAFNIMEVSKIALLTPYNDKINQPIHAYIEENNVEIMSMSTFDMNSDIDVARIPLEAIVDAAKIADHNDAQAVFLSCTALRSIECIDALEKSLGKPVLSSSQVMLWRLLRLAGWKNKIQGFGRLLENN
jgi:maleate isomerase